MLFVKILKNLAELGIRDCPFSVAAEVQDDEIRIEIKGDFLM